MKLSLIVIALCCMDALAQDKIRVLVTNSDAWEAGGGFIATNTAGVVGRSAGGGSRPQTVEIMKTFQEKCKKVQITGDSSKAEYVIMFDRQGGKSMVTKDSKIAVFERGGDLVIAKSVRTVGGAVQDACEAILKHVIEEPKPQE